MEATGAMPSPLRELVCVRIRGGNHGGESGRARADLLLRGGFHGGARFDKRRSGTLLSLLALRVEEAFDEGCHGGTALRGLYGERSQPSLGQELCCEGNLPFCGGLNNSILSGRLGSPWLFLY